MCYGNTKIKCSIYCFSNLQLSHIANKKSLLMLKFYRLKFIKMSKCTFYPDIGNNSASLLPDILRIDMLHQFK